MTKNNSYLVLAVILLSSCGIITKTRYGNGFKLNLDVGFLTKEGKIRKIKTRNEKQLNNLSIISDSVYLTKKNIETPFEEPSESSCFISKNLESELNYKTKSASKILKVKPSYIETTKQITKYPQLNNDERPFAPHLIKALLFMLFIPLLSMVFALKARHAIIESNYLFKGITLSTFVILLSFLIFILYTYLAYLILSLFFI